MKANHVPVTDRLERRIQKLFQAEDDCWVKYGGGNPYRFCRHCLVSNVDETVKGHRVGCRFRGFEKQVAHFKRLLAEAKGE